MSCGGFVLKKQMMCMKHRKQGARVREDSSADPFQNGVRYEFCQHTVPRFGNICKEVAHPKWLCCSFLLVESKTKMCRQLVWCKSSHQTKCGLSGCVNCLELEGKLVSSDVTGGHQAHLLFKGICTFLILQLGMVSLSLWQNTWMIQKVRKQACKKGEQILFHGG